MNRTYEVQDNLCSPKTVNLKSYKANKSIGDTTTEHSIPTKIESYLLTPIHNTNITKPKRNHFSE